MSNITHMWHDEFSDIDDRELARLASRIAEGSEQGAENLGYCIMMACQKLLLEKKRTPDQLSKTLKVFLVTCKDETLKYNMLAAAEGLAGGNFNKRMIYKDKYIITPLTKIRDFLAFVGSNVFVFCRNFLAPAWSYLLAFWKRSIRYFFKVLS